jgi:hypothetical protein
MGEPVFFCPSVVLLFQLVSAMAMLTPVTLTSMCGRHQGIAVVVSATTVSTTQKVSIANAASQASTVTSGDPSLLQTLAKVSEPMVPE